MPGAQHLDLSCPPQAGTTALAGQDSPLQQLGTKLPPSSKPHNPRPFLPCPALSSLPRSLPAHLRPGLSPSPPGPDSHTRVPGRPSPLPTGAPAPRFTSPFHPALRKAPQPLLQASSSPAHTPLSDPLPHLRHSPPLATRQPSPCPFTTPTVTKPGPGWRVPRPLARSPGPPPTPTYRSRTEPGP